MIDTKWHLHNPIFISVSFTQVFTKMTMPDSNIPGMSFITIHVEVKKVNKSLVKAFLLSQHPSFFSTGFSQLSNDL